MPVTCVVMQIELAPIVCTADLNESKLVCRQRQDRCDDIIEQFVVDCEDDCCDGTNRCDPCCLGLYQDYQNNARMYH